MTIKEIATKATPILRANGVEYAAVFGSFARGEANVNSDVDLLVRYTKAPGLFSHIGLAQTLEDTLQTKVDLVTERSLKATFASLIKKDLRVLYGQTIRQDLR